MSEATGGAGGQGGGEMHRARLFLGCIIALVATAFGFIVRAMLLDDWRTQFNLSGQQVGYIVGAGLYPFAISIIFFSLIVDRIGYGISMVFAFAGHAISALVTIFSGSFEALYIGTFLFALSNGVVEAVINPVTATMYAKKKTHYLSILHAGWPGGLVLGGLLAIAMGTGERLGALPGYMWQWKMGLLLIPTVAYGLLLAGQRFPTQERVAAGISYLDMLREFGTASCLLVCFLLLAGLNQILVVFNSSLDKLLLLAGVVESLSSTLPEQLARIVLFLGLAFIPTVVFGAVVRSFGRPMFVFLLIVMLLLATTELGTDSWIADIMSSVLESPQAGSLVLVYTSFIMFTLRFFAGPIVERLSPLGLLATSAAVASVGLLWLSNAGSATLAVFLAATCYGLGKTFFWPATLGVVSEQYPKGGALTLNAIAGVGMLAVGTLGGPLIGMVQDQDFDAVMKQRDPSLHGEVVVLKPGLFGDYYSLDQERRTQIGDQIAEAERAGDQGADYERLVEKKKLIDTIDRETKQGTLAKIAVLPAIMFVCYLGLIFYFQSKGGYKAQALTEHPAAEEY